MDFKLFKQAVSKLNWKLDYFEFCEQILQKKQKRELLVQSKHCLRQWQQWQLLNNALDSFNEDTLERIISVYSSQYAEDKSPPSLVDSAEPKKWLDLPGGLTDYNNIAIPVIELFESFYTVKRERQKGCRDIACWKITDKEQNQSAYLFLSPGFEWGITGKTANERVPDCFLFDVYEFCDANGVYIDELFESIA